MFTKYPFLKYIVKFLELPPHYNFISHSTLMACAIFFTPYFIYVHKKVVLNNHMRTHMPT